MLIHSTQNSKYYWYRNINFLGQNKGNWSEHERFTKEQRKVYKWEVDQKAWESSLRRWKDCPFVCQCAFHGIGQVFISKIQTCGVLRKRHGLWI